MTNNENSKLCAVCVDSCCQRMPGAYMPDDIDLDLQSIADKLAAGEWAIDWWEDEEPIYYLRVAAVGGRPILDPSWGGRCVFLIDSGCKLSFDERPTNCKAVLPSVSECKCPDEYSKHNIALAWRPHEKLLMEAAKMAQAETDSKET